MKAKINVIGNSVPNVDTNGAFDKDEGTWTKMDSEEFLSHDIEINDVYTDDLWMEDENIIFSYEYMMKTIANIKTQPTTPELEELIEIGKAIKWFNKQEVGYREYYTYYGHRFDYESIVEDYRLRKE